MTQNLGRFGHNNNPARDFCSEVEAIATAARLAEGDAESGEGLDQRIQRAMDFRVGGSADAVSAKCRLRAIATARGFDVTGEIAYAGQPLPRLAADNRLSR